ncbi:hypothetical protein SBA1_550118 [Candidatus Sulfotelmatobacter kueseliae]|uniref:Uncharacterized protein n=1 Tax=Candidatus Sulfotelmatobacter kueseliae TaxID=2042962 RepID=A0A2U3KYQ7_9BACT|nr:hypothetical protein SBA1_550118 [Candidatus Sulfotelmatobacter kueseliae]
MFVLEGRIEKPIPRKLEIAAESSLEDRSEFLKFEPPALRVELANFIGWMTAKGVDAEDAEKEFFRMVRQGAWPRIKRRAGYEPKGLTLGMNQPSGRVKGARVLKKEDDSPFKSCAT